jgi:hypothetical protein
MLIDADQAFLDSKGYRWEVIVEGGMISVIIRDYPLPAGYLPQVTDLLLRLPAGFPDAAPDMLWMHPEVAYASGGTPPATEVREAHHGVTWQRWSRHLAQAWRPGVDSLQTYLRLIRTELERGVQVAA